MCRTQLEIDKQCRAEDAQEFLYPPLSLFLLKKILIILVKLCDVILWMQLSFKIQFKPLYSLSAMISYLGSIIQFLHLPFNDKLENSIDEAI